MVLLPAPGLADEGDALAGLDVEVEVVQHLDAFDVAEADVVVRDLAG